jgi:hypothetical protein
MAKEIQFSIGSDTYTVATNKLDRKKLYGYREKIALDDDGDECALVSMSECGTIIIPKGGTGQGHLTPEGSWVDRKQIMTVNTDGSPAVLTRSSYSSVNALVKKATPEELLDCAVDGLYHMDADSAFIEAIGSDIYTFDYCYYDSFECLTAFLQVIDLNGVKELFMLVGAAAAYDLIGYDEVGVADESDDVTEDDESEEFDFGML